MRTTNGKGTDTLTKRSLGSTFPLMNLAWETVPGDISLDDLSLSVEGRLSRPREGFSVEVTWESLKCN